MRLCPALFSACQGSRSCFLVKLLLEVWGTEAQNHSCSGKSCFFGPAAEGGKTNRNHICLKSVRLFCLGTTGLQKTTWPRDHFGIPLSLMAAFRAKSHLRKLTPAGPGRTPAHLAHNLVGVRRGHGRTRRAQSKCELEGLWLSRVHRTRLAVRSGPGP